MDLVPADAVRLVPTALDIARETRAYATAAREHMGRADGEIHVTVPYDPAHRDLWVEAAELVAAERIRFDWRHWEVLTVPRGDLGGGFPPEWLVMPALGHATPPRWAREGTPKRDGAPRGLATLSPADLRRLAAEALLCAEALEKYDPAVDLADFGGGL